MKKLLLSLLFVANGAYGATCDVLGKQLKKDLASKTSDVPKLLEEAFGGGVFAVKVGGKAELLFISTMDMITLSTAVGAKSGELYLYGSCDAGTTTLFIITTVDLRTKA
jgi:hypothetical protein